MIKFSLNNKFFYRYILFFIIIFLSYQSNIFAQNTDSLPANPAYKIFSLEECKNIFTAYYRTGKISKDNIDIFIFGIKSLTQSIDEIILQSKNERDIKKQNELLILYLEHAEIIAIIYNYGLINNYSRTIKKIDKDVKRFLKLSSLDPIVYLKAADYLYTKLLLPEGNKLNIILTLPILYRKTLLFDNTNAEALVKLSCWYIFAANETTSNYNSQINSTEEFIEDLNEIDKFNAYIWYSIYYMKIYNTKKSIEYLHKAEQIFPDHIFVHILYSNYKKGILSL